MQTAAVRIWTQVNVSIPYDSNHYTTNTSNIYIYVCVCVCGIIDTINSATFHKDAGFYNHNEQ